MFCVQHHGGQEDYMPQHTVNIVGLGGIGSWTANKVARIGCPRLILWDDDKVEVHNFANQDYDYPAHLARSKVKATELKLQGTVEWHASQGREMKVIAREERVTRETALRGVVIVTVDNSEARKEIFAACRYNPAIPLYIEAGAAEHRGTVRVFVPHDKDHVRLYEQILDSFSAEGEGPAPCVSPHMGGVFATIIAGWLQRLNEGLRLQRMISTAIEETEEGLSVTTSPIL
jgi:molybdopterin/thiamine biosynthesis adenylyltransferase